MPVITVTGLPGSGVRELAQEVTRLLGADYVDQSIMQQAAHRIGTTVEALAHRDERVHSLGHRLALLLENLLEKSAFSSDPFFEPAGVEILLSRSYEEASRTPRNKAEELSDAHFIDIVTTVMRSEAETGNAVLLGRGGQMVLRDLPGVFHTLVVAPLAQRIPFIMQRDGLDQASAERYVRQREADLVAFHRKFWKVEFTDPTIYDIVVNTASLSRANAAEIVAKAAQAKAGA
ncbi:MAG: cytidylate kinase-like family protein [Chloroflexi bacterium]|nr:cytidylate kinase-like family protein [Chloroflexota bacterium]